jgi:RNA polymerase sigma-70 factor (ECF subfamily)
MAPDAAPMSSSRPRATPASFVILATGELSGAAGDHPTGAANRQLRRGSSPADAAMDRYAGGDETAFAELYDQLGPRLLGYLSRGTRDLGRAEDLLQQTMMQLHRQRDRFVRGAEVTPWAFAIARRFLIDSHRKEKRRRTLERSLAEAEPRYETAADDVVTSMQMAKKVEGELARLPDKQRLVLEMIRQDGLSMSEVAQILGTSLNAVKLRVHRAYATLHATVAGGLGDDAK